MTLPIVHNADGQGSVFYAQYAEETTETPFDGWTEDQLRQWVSALWRDAFEAKRPETARLQRNSCYYEGFHYGSAYLNRINPIENECWRIVEVQVANTIASRPRPEIRPRQGIPGDAITQLQKYATSIEDDSNYDWAVLLGARDKRIYGWNPWIISLDYSTGMPYPRPYSAFDFYWDPGGRNDYECNYWILAGPVPTARVRATYPDVADRIKPDRIASPAYEACVRPWHEFIEGALSVDHPNLATAGLLVHQEGEIVTQTVPLIASPGDTVEHGTTTFLLQLIVRDEELCDRTYFGEMQYANGSKVPGAKYVGKGRRSDSGLWLVTMTSDGTICEAPRPIDTCFDGLPFVVDRVAQRTDRYQSMADLDHVIPIQRGINRMNSMFDRSMELASNPPVLADRLSGLRAQLNGGTVVGGEVLDIARGSDVRYLEYRGPDGRYFERLAERRKVIQDIAGTPESLEGARPAGIEAASALRHLSQTARNRLEGGEVAAHMSRAALLRKLMFCAGAKCQPEITFYMTGGQKETVQSQHLLMDYGVSFAPGTGTVEGTRDLQDKAIALYDRQAIDEQALLETFEWPNAQEIAARMVERKIIEQAQAAAAAARAGGSGGNGNASRSTKAANTR